MGARADFWGSNCGRPVQAISPRQRASLWLHAFRLGRVLAEEFLTAAMSVPEARLDRLALGNHAQEGRDQDQAATKRQLAMPIARARSPRLKSPRWGGNHHAAEAGDRRQGREDEGAEDVPGNLVRPSFWLR